MQVKFNLEGVDYFISVADKILNNKDLDIKFAWIGSGYDPYNDFNVSLWLEDQINRAGIGDRMEILDESNAYPGLIERCDLFLVTSRLDPLPNVAIDALSSGKPVLLSKSLWYSRYLQRRKGASFIFGSRLS